MSALITFFVETTQSDMEVVTKDDLVRFVQGVQNRWKTRKEAMLSEVMRLHRMYEAPWLLECQVLKIHRGRLRRHQEFLRARVSAN